MPKTSDLVARELADQIVSSNMAAGTRLPSEREMTEALGVGRTTLREALRQLETRGVLSMKVGPGGGPVVRHPSPSDFADGLSLILEFESATVEDLMNARSALECTGARRAAQTASAKLVAKLRELNRELVQDTGDDAAFLDVERRFHTCLARWEGSSAMELFVNSLMAIFDDQAAAPLSAAGRTKMHAAHETLISAIESGDPLAAEAAMGAHLRDAYARWRKVHSKEAARQIRWSV
jgi:DNA-binding FadR family transcriptional regulator